MDTFFPIFTSPFQFISGMIAFFVPKSLYFMQPMVYNMSMNMNSRKDKLAFQTAFLKKAGPNMAAVKRMMDNLPNVGFYIKDASDRIVTLSRRNCEISALKDEFDAIGRKSSDLFPKSIATHCLKRDAECRESGKAMVNGINHATVDRNPNPTNYSVFPLHDSKGKLIGTMCGFYTINKEAEHQHVNRLQPAIEYIAAHTDERIPLAKLSQLTDLSVTHFRRLFHESFNETPAKYALRLRLNRARAALETSSKTIAEIAADAGFCDQSHFIHAFKRVYKLSPNGYRSRHMRQER